jgi:type III secretion protein V
VNISWGGWLRTRLAGRTDAVLAIALLIGVVMFIAPLPGAVLDVMVVANLCIATVILLGATYARSMLDYSSLPTILLVTTMFRLALEVAITRLILLEAHGGEVVEAFGEIVAGGNLAVGIVIFVIITVVNFIVITKGSERIAEVGARFSLDAMPGRQMAIDAELRAGHITSEEAGRRRQELARASQMHGGMDGAMKFVKGDAIAGIIILLTNLVGGLIVGVQLHGLTLAESARLYSVLSIGEGLISQLPSLMTSIAAGILISLGENEEKGKGQLGGTIVAQLFASPAALLVSGVVVASLAIAPGIPVVPFVPIGLLCVAVAVVRVLRSRRLQREASTKAQTTLRDEIYFSASMPYRLEIIAGSADAAFVARIEEAVRRMRNGIVARGYMLPVFDAQRPSAEAPGPLRVRFLVNEVPFVDVVLDEGEKVCVHSPEALELAGVEFTRRAFVRGGQQTTVIAVGSAHKASDAGVETVDVVGSLVDAIEEVVWTTSSIFVSLDEAQRMMSWAARNAPALHENAKQVLALPLLAQVIRGLASERVGLRNGYVILDTLCECVPRERDVGLLIERVRVALRHEICQQLAADAELRVVLLEPDTEQLLSGAIRHSAAGSYLAVSLETRDALIESLRAVCTVHQTMKRPIALVTVQDLRPQLRRLLAEEMPSLPVLSFAEFTNHLSVSPVGEVSVQPALA